jgi:transcriptional regulator
MLIHPWDAAGEQEWRDLLEAHPFGVLVSLGTVDGWPVSVPTQFVLSAPRTLELHLARPNPLWRALEADPRVMLCVAADWTYVPSAWKAIADEDPLLGVPTTYYAAVELCGRATVVDDRDGVAAVLRRQLTALQPGLAVADPLDHGRRLDGILGLRIDVERVRAKLKYGGNADDAHRAAVARHLHERGTPADLAALRHLPDGAPNPLACGPSSNAASTATT